MTMKRLMLCGVGAIALGQVLGGCAILPERASGYGTAYGPAHEAGPWVQEAPREKEMLLAKSDFSVGVVRFTDLRRPRSMEDGPDDRRLYLFEPDTLLSGVSTRLPALFEKYLAYRPQVAKHYKVELELRQLRTEVLAGTFFSGRSMGRYEVSMEILATARRPDSSVVLQKVYRYQETQPRGGSDGRGPSKEMDRARLTDLVDAGVRLTAQNIGWALRQGDARRWKPDARPAGPHGSIRMAPQPVLERATGSMTGMGSELIIPAKATAPAPFPNPLNDPVSLPVPRFMPHEEIPHGPRYAPDSVPVMGPVEDDTDGAVVPITWGYDALRKK
jgi:hypothetical protein